LNFGGDESLDDVAAQKYDGLSAQPIWRANGITMRVGCPGGSGMT
jgi:hypothetical protein